MDGGAVTALADNLRRSMSERIDEFEMKPLAGLSDRDDLHVHAAAIGGSVDMLLTLDTDFLSLPDSITDALPYEILTPDSFLVLVDDSGPEYVREVVDTQWEYWRKKDPSVDLPQRLREVGCPIFAERVYRHQRN